MKNDRLIDNDKLAEAEPAEAANSMISKAHFTWPKVALTAASVGLVAVVVFFVMPTIWPDTEQMEITTPTATTTVVETSIIQKWAKMEVFEKYIGGAIINGTEYKSGVNKLEDSSIGEPIGSLELTGYDIYEDKTYYINADYYAINSIDPDCVIAVHYNDYDGYYSFYNSAYEFKTLGDLIDKLDLRNNLQINNSFVYYYWLDNMTTNGNGDFRTDYYKLSDPEIVWDTLLTDTDSINEGADVMGNLGFEIITISINYAPSGQSNIGVGLTENGYLATNILGTWKIFNISKEHMLAFRDYVLVNGTIFKTTYGSPAE